MAPKGKHDPLTEYRRKRSADQTPEPFDEGSAPQPGLFVVQKHAATRMHYDLRLEMHGALQSWAVPKGPSFDPEVKRLAMEVEEHPLEYADFEGIIPAGNYGAGAVIVWDKGLWIPVEDPEEGMRKGKLLFDLRGYKLRGRWTLFRTSKGKPNEWLMMKKPDAYADPANLPGEESIHSGMTVEELRDGVDRAARVRKRLKQLKTPEGDLRIQQIELMLAQPQEEAFSRPGWIFEIKYDGYRLLGEARGGRPRLRYRRGNDVTALFPEIAKALKALPYTALIVDGEIVVLDDAGKPSFQALQQRVHLTRTADIARAVVDLPATLFAFDLPAFEAFDLRGLPLSERKQALAEVMPKAGPLRYCDHVEEQGEAMYEAVREMGLEGIVGKRADSKYTAGRSGDWIKIRADRNGDFVIVGYSPPSGARSGFGALHLAVCEAGGLVYAGRVGSGFNTRQLEELHADLERIRRDEPPCTGPVPTTGEHVWVEPRLVCEVRYKEWTGAGQLRHPVFLRLRDDKPVEDCRREGAAPAVDAASAEPAKMRSARERTVSFTNLKKVFWPDEGYTKGDLIDYYRKISRWIMPYLEDRPLVLTRYPDGIDGKHFFQKDAPGFVSEWIRTEKMWSEHAQREIHYFVCDSLDSLLYVINLGSIPLHLWSSRIADLQHPDWCILDLDPKDAPFDHVIQLALAARALCREIELECHVKTSGSTGLHVLLPLGGMFTYEQSRKLGEVLARILVSRLPDISTITRNPAKRAGKVYIDFVQNGHGRLLVAPFCVRPLAGAPVSTPLRWSEVKRGLDIRRFTILNVPERMRRMRVDPLRAVMSETPDLERVLERLMERLE